MTLKRALLFVAVAAVATAATFLYVHRDSPNPFMPAVQTASMLPQTVTEESLNTALAEANLPIKNLSVRLTDGVTVVRGRTHDTAAAAAAIELLQRAGAPRIMNVIRIDVRTSDDEIARVAERRLVTAAGLEGCRFSVQSRDGVLHVSGTIYSDLQRDTAARVLKRIDGVTEVRTDLKKL